MWDSDKDKLELFVQYKDTTAKMNKTKYSRNQKTGEFKWVSYQFDLTPFTTEIADLGNRLIEKFTEYRICLLYTSPSPRDTRSSRMPSSA